MQINSQRHTNCVFISFLSLVSALALSAPYFNKAHDFTQPDGSTVTLILNGDEFYMQAETPDGYTVIRDPESGWICYAELSEDGSELVSTGIAVSEESTAYETQAAGELKRKEKKIAPGKILKQKINLKTESKLHKIKQKQKRLFGENVNVIKGLAYPASSTDASTNSNLSAHDYQSLDLLETDAGSLPPTKNSGNFNATIQGLVLIFDFSDAPVSYTIDQYRDKVNKSNYHYSNGNAASLRTYYEDVSRGVFLMDHYVYGIYRAPQTFAYYDSLDYGEGAHQLMSLALNDMEANGFDFSQLSTFSSGEIRALCVMYTGNPPTWADGMWWHQGWWSGFSADGVHTGRYCTDTANDLNPGTLIHEHGHMVAEWPDTYSYVGGEPGTWGVMGGGYCDLPNPYFLYENGWLDAENILGNPGLLTMNSTDPHFAYVYYDPAQPTEFYIIRPYVTSLMYCPSIPDQGLTIWRINTEGDNANYPDTDRHIELVHANNNDSNKTTNVCFKEGGLLDHFTSSTTPSSNWQYGSLSGDPSGMDLTDISAAGSQMTFINGTAPEPIPYYPLNSSFNDASGSGNTATGYNFNPAAQWSADTFDGSYDDLGTCLKFDGVDDYAACSSAASASDDLTIAFWIKPDLRADMIPLDKFPANAVGAGWSIRLTQDGYVDFLIGSQTNYTLVRTICPVYEANRWAHIACTYSSGTAEIFVNGAPRAVKKAITQTPNTTSLNVQMGKPSQVSSSQIYQGLLDDVRFYNTALGSGPLNTITGLNFKPDKGLLAYLRLDEISGTEAQDISGHHNHGILQNGLSFSANSITGPVGKAVSFDGVDDYISLPSGMSKRNGGFTVTLWANPTAVKGWSRFIDFGNGSYSDNVLLARYQSTNSLVFETYNGSTSGGYVIAPDAIELNQWQFFAASVDTSGKVKLYKNDQVVKTGTSAALPQIYRRNLYIGRSNWSADSYYEGAMDDIHIYNYTLSDAEIVDIYENNRFDAPIPFSGNNAVSPDITLGFTPAGNALRHDIYFGREYNSVLNADTQSDEYVGRKQFTQYNPPSLEGWRDYFWRVDELMVDGTIKTGPVWRFSTIGSIQRQVWTGLSGVDEVTDLTNSPDYPDNPSLVTDLSIFQIPTDWDDSYGTRVHGLLVPQTSGNYRFWISGDNEVELWLSSNADPANVSRIAYIHGTWSSPQNFDLFTSQRSSLITLTAGQPYYIMALHKEGNGGDHMAVAWQGPDSPDREIIDNFWLRAPVENEWPVFDSSATPTMNTIEGVPFSAALPMNILDPDSDSLSFIKQTGPNWLQVASDGSLSGIPTNSDAGINSFTLRAGDNKGGFDDTLLTIDVADRFTGSMGLSDLLDFAQEWLSDTPDSPGNLDQAVPVNLDDFALFSEKWNTEIIDGLVAHWKLDDSKGLTARDSYGHHHGTLTNMTEYNWATGTSGNAIAFDGIDDYIEMTGYQGVLGTSSRTSCAWIKTTNTAPGIIMSWGTEQSGQKWMFWVESNGTLGLGVWGGYIRTTAAVNDGQWHHVAAVLADDGSPTVDEILLYIDGVLQTDTYASSAQSIDTTSGQDVMIGAYLTGGAVGAYFNGLIDDARIYSRVLNEMEIAKIAERNLQMNLRFDEIEGTISHDASFYRHDGILNNTENTSWILGYVNNALALDGVDDYVEVPTYQGILGASDRTCTAWIKTTNTAPGIIMSWGTEQSGQKWMFWVESNGTLGLGVWGGYIRTTATVNDGQWHHVAAVMIDDGSPSVDEILLYIDGILQTDTYPSSTQSIDTAAVQNVMVGAYLNAGAFSAYFNGIIDDVRIYDTALTIVDIQDLIHDKSIY